MLRVVEGPPDVEQLERLSVTLGRRQTEIEENVIGTEI